VRVTGNHPGQIGENLDDGQQCMIKYEGSPVQITPARPLGRDSLREERPGDGVALGDAEITVPTIEVGDLARTIDAAAAQSLGAEKQSVGIEF
jgi:hypothetical protein